MPSCRAFSRHTPFRARREALSSLSRGSAAVPFRGAILATAADKQRILPWRRRTGSQRSQGRNRNHRHRPEASLDHHVALGSGSRFPGSPQDTFVRQGHTRIRSAITVGGLAFLPKGFRLAVRITTARPLVSERQGGCAGIPGMEGFASWRHCQSGRPLSGHAMQEPMRMLRLADRKHMRMSGYASRVTS